nr:GNAT family N-acyltransferase [Cognatishimia sp. F0-27]
MRGRLFGPHGACAETHDAHCGHILIECRSSGDLVGGCRVHLHRAGADALNGPAAEFYDLSGLAAYPRPMLEIGRFCVAPHPAEPETIRLIWGMLTRICDAYDVGLLFGCSSFAGCDPAVHAEGLSWLARHHAAPTALSPGMRAPETVRLAELGAAHGRDGRSAIPALLRGYLSLGGWVSDHAVIDRRFGTLHVFTGVETNRIPDARKRSLRAIAARGHASPIA